MPTIERIATRDIEKLNRMVQQQNPALSISMSKEDLAAMCRDVYVPLEGARGVVGEIDENIKPEIAKTVLFQSNASGVMKITYDHAAKAVTVNPATPENEEEKKPEGPVSTTAAANATFAPAG